MDNKEIEKNKDNKKIPDIIKKILIVAIIVVLILLIRNIVQIVNLSIENKDSSETINNNPIIRYDETEENSVEIGQKVNSIEREKMTAEGISEEFFYNVVIKDEKIYNYNLLNEFYNSYSDVKYNGPAVNTELKILQINGDSQSQQTIKVQISDNLPGEPLQGFIIIEDENGSETYNYYSNYITRECIVDNNGNDVIVCYIIKDGEKRELCRYLLSSTTYYTNFDFEYMPNGDNQIVKKSDDSISTYPVYVMEGEIEIISHELTGDVRYSVQECIKQGFFTNINDLIKQANYDYSYGKCKKEMLQDGGTLIYQYNGFAIVFPATLIDGGENTEIYNSVYFAQKDVTIENIKNSL